MEDQFLSVKTWQGYVMVSASLLPLCAEETNRIYPDYNAFECILQEIILSNSKAIPLITSWPSMATCWDPEPYVQVEPDMDAIYNMGSIYAYSSSDVGLPSLDPITQDRSSSTPPEVSDSASTPDEHYEPFSPWVPNSYSSDGNSPVGSEGPTTVTIPTSLSRRTQYTTSTSSLNHSYLLSEKQPALIIGATQRSLPLPSTVPARLIKRRRLRTSTESFCNTYTACSAEAAITRNVPEIQSSSNYDNEAMSTGFVPQSVRTCLRRKQSHHSRSSFNYKDALERSQMSGILKNLKQIEYQQREHAKHQFRAIKDSSFVDWQ